MKRAEYERLIKVKSFEYATAMAIAEMLEENRSRDLRLAEATKIIDQTASMLGQLTHVMEKFQGISNDYLARQYGTGESLKEAAKRLGVEVNSEAVEPEVMARIGKH